MNPMTTPPLGLTAERLTALRETANAATHTVWAVMPSQQTRGAWAIPGVASTIRANGADARHIAAFDPPTALGLLDRLENAESAWTNWQNVALGMQARAEAAEKKVAAVEALVVTAEDAPIEYRSSIQTSHLRAALDGGA